MQDNALLSNHCIQNEEFTRPLRQSQPLTFFILLFLTDDGRVDSIRDNLITLEAADRFLRLTTLSNQYVIKQLRTSHFIRCGEQPSDRSKSIKLEVLY